MSTFYTQHLVVKFYPKYKRRLIAVARRSMCNKLKNTTYHKFSSNKLDILTKLDSRHFGVIYNERIKGFAWAITLNSIYDF